ncbi:S26 family signal peptidase [Sphingopyxis sp.]|uniref:S26 family signal peptidase n=1 Tax=Sphingopyxis sp. TaxID=1908224 RepID=UPI003BA8E223
MSRRWLRATVLSGALFSSLFGALAVLAPQPRLLWNASASVPIGLYRIEVGARPALGDFVAIDPPERIAALLDARGYLPRGVPLLKKVAAAEGMLVCRSGTFVTIDGAPAARALSHDRAGRMLPLWLGCRRLQRGEMFLLGTRPDSLDGRYFGPLPASGLIGTAHPVATRDRPGAPLRWRIGCCTSSPTEDEKEPAQ